MTGLGIARGVVVDTGPIVALLNRADEHHERCVRWAQTAPGPMFVPPTVLTEVCWLIEKRVGTASEGRFLQSFGSGPFQLVPLVPADLVRMASLVDRYADLPLGAVDASVVALAERLGISQVATLDRRHFRVVRPAHAEAFTLLPG